MTERGTRRYWQPANAGKADTPTGKARGNGRFLPEPLADWMFSDERACKDHPTLWWYAPQKDPIELRGDDDRLILNEDGDAIITGHITISTDADAKAAIAICATCPLDLDCGEYGLRHEFHGIWGGKRLDGLSGQQKDDLLAGVERERKRRQGRAS